MRERMTDGGGREPHARGLRRRVVRGAGSRLGRARVEAILAITERTDRTVRQ